MKTSCRIEQITAALSMAGGYILSAANEKQWYTDL